MSSSSKMWRKSLGAFTTLNKGSLFMNSNILCNNYNPIYHISSFPPARTKLSTNCGNVISLFHKNPNSLRHKSSYLGLLGATKTNYGCRIHLRINGSSTQNYFLPISYFSSLPKQDSKELIPPEASKTVAQSFVDFCPNAVQPYLKISRVNKPIGTWLLFWPCTWGLALGAGGPPELGLLTMFGVGAFIMRGAGCTVNDMWDRQIDKKVKRTADRPLAAGDIRMRHATAWLALQLTLALSILVQLNSPCFILGVGALGLVTIYPLAKRVTNWPQAVLGLTFNMGVLMGFTAALSDQLGYLATPWVDPSVLSLYLAGISWTLIYDTIYAHQDRQDDTTLGLGSTARRFGENTKAWLSLFSCAMVSSLTATGIMSDLNWPYYAGIAAVASHLAWQIKSLDIHDAQNCSDRFTANRHIGWMIFLSIIGSCLVENSKKQKAATAASTVETLSRSSILNSGKDSSNSSHAGILSSRSTLV